MLFGIKIHENLQKNFKICFLDNVLWKHVKFRGLGEGIAIPAHQYPIKRDFKDGKFSYLRSHDCKSIRNADPLSQVVAVPSEQLVIMLELDIHKWFLECFSLIRSGPSVKYEWKTDFAPGSWVDGQLKSFLEKYGPTREIVLAAIYKYLLLKSTIVHVQKAVLASIESEIMPEFSRWQQELGESAQDISESLHDGEASPEIDVLQGLDIWVKTKITLISQRCHTKPRSVLMIVLDFLQQKPEHAKLRAKSNEQRDAEQKKEAETEPKVTFIQDLSSRMITSKFTIMVSQTA